MKKLNRYFLLLLAVIGLVGLSACKDDDDPFVGSDNYIHEFTLNVSGKSYEGYILNDIIEFVLPTGTDLKGAKAAAEICENATISPDPASISNWGTDEQRFTVTAHNRETREYKVVIKYELVSYDGNVSLNTQSEVDAFAKQNIKIINGYLQLGTNVKEGADSIKNLSGIAGVIKVKNSIIIGKGLALNTLDGFKSLTDAANIYFGSSKSSLALADSLDIEFPVLESVGEVTLSANLLRSARFPKLKTSYLVFINSTGVKEIDFPSLENSFAGVTVQGSVDGKTYNNTLKTLNFSNLQQTGGLTLKGLKSHVEFNLPKLKTVDGNLDCSKLDLIEKMVMPELSSVTGDASISQYNKCATIELPKLESVGGNLKVKGEYNDRFPKTLVLNNLKEVKGIANFEYLGVKELDLSKLESVGKSIKFFYASSMEHLLTPVLKNAGDVFEMSSCNAIKELDLDLLDASTNITLHFIDNIEKIALPKEISKFSFIASSMKVFPEITGAEKIKTFLLKDGDLESLSFNTVKEIDSLYANTGKYSYLSFPELTKMRAIYFSQYNLKKFSAPKLEVIGKAEFEFMWIAEYDFPVLKEITGEFKFWGATSKYSAGNCKIEHLNGFSSLEKVGSVYVKRCPNLIDFSAFKKALPSLTPETWKVEDCKYNPTYQDLVDGKYKM